ncbi:MarR family winged helix-turn-helix transcriptional regulator [Xanthovirga aplysinae]|uniref:MarR family winged helix-turn-helix transcriptional regulator n=1 Tax=Xanthovirga aplysinae TaxID=2529853 RepID=UPI0012BB49F9|nr:MarR family transcriptional regulator [Xanthovirga aplysinae]MTI29719.1 MarR family transcriptional regulator [Xanthovirga aplysinae]
MANIDQEVKTKFTNNKHRFLTNLVFTANWFNNMFVEFLKPYGISPQQFNILRILRGANDWVSMNDIKALMVDKSPNATRLSDKLLEKELVERKRSEQDRRVVYLALSKKGEELLEAIDKSDNSRHMEVEDRITEEEAKQFSDILDKIRG